MSDFHPELRRAARLIPRFSFTPGLARFARWLQRRHGAPVPQDVPGVTIRDAMLPGSAGHPPVRVRLYLPEGVAGPRPAMLWVHGGGFIIGSPEQDAAKLITLSRDLGMVIAAVAYRLGPEHPFPAGLEDAYAALRWLHAGADGVAVDPSRIVIGGASAGGGLAAGLVLHAHDRGEVPVAFQLLIYPMLDDRTVLRTDIDQSRLRLWTTKSNRLGWSCYLGHAPGAAATSEYAAPARRANLAGLPPAWIGVGTCDLFHDEDVDYARRLGEAGVPCGLTVVEGAFHGFDVVAKAAVAGDFREAYEAALRAAIA
jgi:acetyl esterase/lipase